MTAPDTVTATFRTLDKLEKIGEEAVRKALAEEAGLTADAIDTIFRFLAIDGPSAEVVAQLREFFGRETTGVDELDSFLGHLDAFEIDRSKVEVDLSIARGIDYYTGMVFETELTDRPDFGSIMSGGRYDGLIGMMTGREVPAVGISMGVDRLVAALADLDRLSTPATPTRVLVVSFGREGFADAQRLANRVRAAGIPAEVSHQHAKVGAQFKYADKKGIPFVLTQGEDERTRDVVKLKNLSQQSEAEMTLAEAIAILDKPTEG